MPETSGERQAPAGKSPVYDVAVKVSTAIILVVLTGAYGLLWAHENRITVMEVRDEGIKEDLAEIKADVKKLLGGNR